MTDQPGLWSLATPAFNASVKMDAEAAISILSSNSFFVVPVSSVLETAGTATAAGQKRLMSPGNLLASQPTLHRTLASSGPTPHPKASKTAAEGMGRAQNQTAAMALCGQPFSAALSKMSQKRAASAVRVVSSNATPGSISSASSLTDFLSLVTAATTASGATSKSSSITSSGQGTTGVDRQPAPSPAPSAAIPLPQTAAYAFLRSALPASLSSVGRFVAKVHSGLTESKDSPVSQAGAASLANSQSVVPMSPAVDNFLSPSSVSDTCAGYSMGSPSSLCSSLSPEVMDFASGDLDESGYSDVNVNDSSSVKRNNKKSTNNNNNNNDNGKNDTLNSDSQNDDPSEKLSESSTLPAKRKRVRKSRAKPQDPVHKIIVKRTRRVRANDRERTRMHGLNDAMDELRKHIPSDGSAGKMTKIDTLRTAANYIRVLKMMLGEMDKCEDVSSVLGCSWSSGDVVMAAVHGLCPQQPSLSLSPHLASLGSPDSAADTDGHYALDDFPVPTSGGLLQTSSSCSSGGGVVGDVVSHSLASSVSPPGRASQGQFATSPAAFQSHNGNFEHLCVPGDDFGLLQQSPTLSDSERGGVLLGLDNDLISKNVSSFRQLNVNDVNPYMAQTAGPVDSVHFGAYSMFQQSSQCY